jgi:hypothetical protein
MQGSSTSRINTADRTQILIQAVPYFEDQEEETLRYWLPKTEE